MSQKPERPSWSRVEYLAGKLVEETLPTISHKDFLLMRYRAMVPIIQKLMPRTWTREALKAYLPESEYYDQKSYKRHKNNIKNVVRGISYDAYYINILKDYFNNIK